MEPPPFVIQLGSATCSSSTSPIFAATKCTTWNRRGVPWRSLREMNFIEHD